MRVARALRDADGFEPVMVFAGGYPERDANAHTCEKEGLKVVGAGAGTAAATVGAPSQAETKKGFDPRGAINRSLLSVPLWVRRDRAEMARAARLLDEARADVLVLSEDNPGYTTSHWIAAAHKMGMAVAIIPYTVAGAREFGESLLDNREHSGSRIGNRIAASLFPKWSYRHRDKSLVRLPAPRLIAREMMKLGPPLPWTLHSGSADAIAVESERMMKHYRSEGLPADRLRVTGSLSDDILAEVLRKRDEGKRSLLSRAGLDPSLPLLLCAPPPDQFVYYGSQTEYASYGAMMDRWIEALNLPGWNVILRPHPREERRTLKLAGSRMRVVTEDTASLVPLCDLYVASVSATIRWAIACGIPVVNFDAYRLRYGDYDDVPGVLRMETQSEFGEALRRIAADPGYLGELTSLQRRSAPEWGMLDGGSGKRILSLLSSMGESRRKAS